MSDREGLGATGREALVVSGGAALDVGGAENEDPRRLAYMLAWRREYIKRLEEALRGQEEEHRILSALLAVSLSAVAHEDGALWVENTGEERVLCIPHEAVATHLRRCRMLCEREETMYRLRFLPVGSEEADDAESEA